MSRRQRDRKEIKRSQAFRKGGTLETWMRRVVDPREVGGGQTVDG